MSSRENQAEQEDSDDETDEDYLPDDEESEEEYVQSEAAAAESPELDLLFVPAGVGHESEERNEENGEAEEIVLMAEVERSTSPEQECEENRSNSEEHSQAESDPSCLPCCPICLAPWTSDGPHRVCCIPCGHVYGRSCLEKWIKKCKKNAAKCPQCCARFKQREMINLYAPLIAVTNIDLEKELLLLREKNESLALERDRLHEEIKKSKKMACFEVKSIGALQRRSCHVDEGLISVIEPVLENRLVSQNNLNTNGSTHHRCVLQNEIPVEGARVLGIDASSQLLVVSGKKPGQDGEHILNKISLLGRCDIDRIQLPPMTGAVRDLCILPGSLALIASLGKKLSLLSMFSNNLVLKYDLPVPAWSCSGDVNEPYHIYAGLQNGMLLMFDIRQTAHCLQSIEGLSRFPIHSIYSLQQNHCSRKVLTASSVGLCLWDVSGCGERPFLIPELEGQGICVSLACDSSSSDIVASFRPKMDLSGVPMPSQTAPSPSQPLCSAVKLGSHLHLNRVNDTHFQKGHVVSCHLSEVRMSKSAIICNEGKSPLFACGDESTRGVNLWNLPSFQVHSRHRPHQSPILDMKYSNTERLGLLSCISENKLQVFTCF